MYIYIYIYIYICRLLCIYFLSQDVRFLLTDFQLEDCINCACDALTIYNGPDDTAPQLQVIIYILI